MTSDKEVVEAYIEGFRRSDRDERRKTTPEGRYDLAGTLARACCPRRRGLRASWAARVRHRNARADRVYKVIIGSSRAGRYAAPHVVSDDDGFLELAERWRPFRT